MPPRRDRRGRGRRGPAAVDPSRVGNAKSTGRRSEIAPAHPASSGRSSTPTRAAGGGPARSPGRARRTPRTAGRRSRASSARGSSRRSIRVIAAIAAGRSAMRPDRRPRRGSREPSTAVSSTAGTATGKPVTSALIWFQNALRAGPPQTRISRDLRRRPRASAPRRAGSRAPTPRRSPAPMWPRPWPSVRPASTPRASGSQIGERSPARYGRKTRPSAPGGVARRLGEQRVGRDRAAEDAVAIPVERAARRGHRRPDAEQPGQRRRRHERAGDLDRPVPVHAEPAGRAARIVGVARLEQPGAEVARERVDRAADDRDAGGAGRARRRRSSVSRADDLAARRRPAAGDRDGTPAAATRPRPGRPDPGTSGAPATPVSRKREPLPGREVPARARRRRRARGARPRARPAGHRAPSRGCPVAAASELGLLARRGVSRNVIAGRVASPRASTATSVGPWPSTPIATTSAWLGRAQRPDRADDRRPPGPRILLGPARAADRRRGRSRRGASASEAAVERDEPGLDLGRAEVDAEDGRRAGAHRARSAVAVEPLASSATTASAVATSVTSVRTSPARSAPRIGADLGLARTPRRSRPGRVASRRASNAMTRSRRAGQTNRPSRSNGAIEDLADRAAARRARRWTSSPTERGAPRRPADPEQRDVEPIPQVDRSPADAGVRDERPLRGGVVDQPRRHQPARLATERVGDPPVRLALRPVDQ